MFLNISSAQMGGFKHFISIDERALDISGTFTLSLSLYLESWLLCMRSLTTTPARSHPLLPLFCSSLLLHFPLDSPNWSGTIWVGRPLRPRGHHRVALLGGLLGGCWWSPSGYVMRGLFSINRWGMARTSSLFSYSSVKWSPLAVFIGSDVTPILTRPHQHR